MREPDVSEDINASSLGSLSLDCLILKMETPDFHNIGTNHSVTHFPIDLNLLILIQHIFCFTCIALDLYQFSCVFVCSGVGALTYICVQWCGCPEVYLCAVVWVP
jgi:hypothetical protein